jgi:NhaD family Na+/H+ antiporter
MWIKGIMTSLELSSLIIVLLFFLGYGAIILEHYIKVNKTAVALFIAATCWMAYFLFSGNSTSDSLSVLSMHVGDVAQIILFLMGAMALVELIDCHRGFKIITDLIHTTSKRKLLWIVGGVAFFLSSVLDNLTTTILMISLLRKLIPKKEDRLLLSCLVVIAANSGGAWTPIGDVTTTMLWINGQISTLQVMKALFIPSVISLIVPLLIFTFQTSGSYKVAPVNPEDADTKPGGRLVFFLGIAALVFVPIFKAFTGLPPFMGIMIGFAVLWLVTDILHDPYEERYYLRVPHILTRIDISGILFFLGILLTVNALESAGILQKVAVWLSDEIGNLPLIATLIGIISAVVDNVPLVAATMGMYPIQEFATDSPLWHMIAYAAGTGGSILIIGSAAGVALMGLEKVDFLSYMKKVSLPALLGYLAGMGLYLLL